MMLWNLKNKYNKLMLPTAQSSAIVQVLAHTYINKLIKEVEVNFEKDLKSIVFLISSLLKKDWAMMMMTIKPIKLC